MVYGDFNANLTKPEIEEWDKEITADLAAVGIEDMLAHFLL